MCFGPLTTDGYTITQSLDELPRRTDEILALENCRGEIMRAWCGLGRSCERFVALLLGMLHVVLLQLAVQGGLSDAEHARRRKLVAPRFAQSAENRAPLQFIERQ